MKKTIISVQNVSKTFRVPHEKRDTLKEHFVHFFRKVCYETFYALKNIHLDIEAGDFYGIVGLNGSGKSTLLKILAGIYREDEGCVTVSGTVSPFLELGVGFNSELTGRENVFLNAKILGMTQAEIEKKYPKIVRFAELENFMDMKVKNYSSGMYVRLAFSVAIQADADIFLCDEVLAVGDMHFQQKCYDIFQQLKKQGKTIVFVSHDLASVRRFCNKCALLEHGKIVAHGDPSAILDQYIYGQGESTAAQFLSTAHQPSPPIDHGNRKVEIVNAEFFDKNGKASTHFLSGDSFAIHIHYRRNEPVSDCIFGIAIYGENGEYFYGTNTDLQNKIVPLKDSGVVILKIKKNVFLRGKLILTIAAHSKNGVNYDWRDKAYEVFVTSNTSADGMLNFDCEWEFC